MKENRRNIIFKITDYIEPDLNWEAKECKNLGIDFHPYQMKKASPSELIRNFKDADILLTNMATINNEVINGLDNLKLLLRHGIGYEKIDVGAATRKGIVFANQANASSEDVAEHAIMLIFETYRKRKLQDKVLQSWINSKKWSSDAMKPIYRMKGKILGIIGCGNIGSRLLKKMSSMGLTILVCDPYLSKERYKELGTEHTPFDEVLKRSDILSIHVPLTQETRGMFNMQKLKQMKKSAVLINTARGEVIHTLDLIQALKENIISGAGIDVYESEPPAPDSELVTLENVILTPHMAWYSEEGSWDIRFMILDDVRSFLKGELPRCVVNPEVLGQKNLRYHLV